jgi:hypothetical protein
LKREEIIFLSQLKLQVPGRKSLPSKSGTPSSRTLQPSGRRSPTSLADDPRPKTFSRNRRQPETYRGLGRHPEELETFFDQKKFPEPSSKPRRSCDRHSEELESLPRQEPVPERSETHRSNSVDAQDESCQEKLFATEIGGRCHSNLLETNFCPEKFC